MDSTSEPSIVTSSVNKLMVKLKSNGFGKERCNFKQTLLEFFMKMNVPDPLIHPQRKGVSLYFKMRSEKERNRLLELSNTQKDQWIIFKCPVTASFSRGGQEENRFLELAERIMNCCDPQEVVEDYERPWENRKYPEKKGEVLDLLMPYRNIPYKAQLEHKVEMLKASLVQCETLVKTELTLEKRIEEQNFPSFPQIDQLIESPKETGFFSEFVLVELEYDVERKLIEAGLVVVSGDRRSAYYLLPIEECIQVAPSIRNVATHFVEYLTSNMDGLKQFKEIDAENRTGLVHNLLCAAGDNGEVQLTVTLSYYSNPEDEFAPLDEIDRPRSLKAMHARYRAKQQGDKQDQVYGKSPEQEVVEPLEDTTPLKQKKPDWSSESGNPNGYKFVAQDFEDCHPSFRFLDFAQVDSHLDVAVPFLTKFFEENKEKLNISGIYINWVHVTRRPVEWWRHVRMYHHVCGEIRVTKNVGGFPIHKFPFVWSFRPFTPNYETLMKLLAEVIEVKKNEDLALACEYRAVYLFFIQICRNIIALNEMTEDNWRVAKSTISRIIFTGNNLRIIDFAYRKAEAPPAALIIWGTAKNLIIKRFVAFGVKKIAHVAKIKIPQLNCSSPNKYMNSELTKICTLVYPYLTLKRIIPIDCYPGRELMYIVALFEENTEAPPLPPVVLLQLEPELESKLPSTAIPATCPLKRNRGHDVGADAKRKKYSSHIQNTLWTPYGGGSRRRGNGRGRGGLRGDRDRSQGGSVHYNPEKEDLLKQIQELKARQKRLENLLPGSGSSRDDTPSSFGEQRLSYYGSGDQYSRLKFGKGASSSDRYGSDHGRYGGREDYRRGSSHRAECGRYARSGEEGYSGSHDQDHGKNNYGRGSSHRAEGARSCDYYGASGDEYSGSRDQYGGREDDGRRSSRTAEHLDRTTRGDSSYRAANRYNYNSCGSRSSSITDSEKLGGYCNSPYHSATRSTPYGAYGSSYLTSRVKDPPSAPIIYRSAYDDILESKEDDYIPLPPPPPVISKR